MALSAVSMVAQHVFADILPRHSNPFLSSEADKSFTVCFFKSNKISGKKNEKKKLLHYDNIIKLRKFNVKYQICIYWVSGGYQNQKSESLYCHCMKYNGIELEFPG